MLSGKPLPTSENDSLFSDNKKIEIVIDDAVKYNAVIRTKIQETIVISMLSKEPKDGINQGDTLKFFLESSNDPVGDSNFYSCYSLVAGVVHNNSSTHIGIKYPDKIEKLGIRKFFRMPIKMQVFYRSFYLNDPYDRIEDIPERYFIDMISSFTTDISGSGIKFLLHENCRKGQSIALIIPDLNNLRVLGKIEWLQPTELDNGTNVALSYININSNVQDKIIAFIFSMLRKKRSRT